MLYLQRKEDNLKEYYKILKNVTLFEGLKEEELESVLNCLSSKTTRYGKNQVILHHGENTTNIGIVLSGQTQVMKEDYYGNRNLIANLSEGMLFGETFVCADIKTLPVSVISTTESVILWIDYRRIISPCTQVCSFHSTLIYNMLRILSMKNLLLSQKIEFISKRTTREKLVAYLSSEAQKNGSNHFLIPFNRQELADYLSVDRSAMSAELSRLKSEGILDYHKNQFTLL